MALRRAASLALRAPSAAAALRAAPAGSAPGSQLIAAACFVGGSQQQAQAAGWGSAGLWVGATACAAGAAGAAASPAHADAAAPEPAQQQQQQQQQEQQHTPPADSYVLPPPRGRLPHSITLYQYEVCPFCCKVKAFLDYNKLPYTSVEVNPLTKGELRSWSSYRKVPVVRLDDEVVVDSSAIISRLEAELLAQRGGGGKKAGWLGGKAAPAGGSGGVSAAEEARWRKWVDERFVKVMTANIYRSWDESWGTFSYMTQQSHWNWAVQQGVRVTGALLMWQIGQRMPKKYNINGDLREALYRDADEFIAAVGPSRPFLGGSAPNLADLGLYGVLTAIRGTPTYNDVVLHSSIGPWLARMALAVGDSCEVKATAGAPAGAPAVAAATA